MKSTTGFLIGAILLLNSVVVAQVHTISTQDVTHFWEAFDKLASATTKDDSISIIQHPVYW